ncbi:MAG TPA: hypothetical protein VFW66_03700 [Gemmatimonadales bacterium]|nr:hypothetical protein [Gemmatimonadales bacterium]
MRARLSADFERFRRELPRDFADHVRQAYGVNLATHYLGMPLPHPIGKGSGQLSLNADQLETDCVAGLAYVVLKTVIAEDPSGARAMDAWAIHETRMRVEPRRARDGREGWTVTWKGRGWDRDLAAYCELVRSGRRIMDEHGMLVVPSVKYHLPRVDEPFRDAEYVHTTAELARAWGAGPLLVEQDFSPTLAGDALGDERARILRWIAEVPARVRAAAPGGARVSLKLMNARFDDDFQVAMLEAAARSADAAVAFNRLFDAELGAAYGGWDLSDRNFRALALARGRGVSLPPLAGSGNVCSGHLLLEYARLGCASVQLHTFFQLPLGAYPATAGSRTQRALHALVFHPIDGLVAGLLDRADQGQLERRGGELHFLDVVGA